MDLVKGLAASMNESPSPDTVRIRKRVNAPHGMTPPSPMARVAHRTMLARRAAAKMHARAEQRTKNKPKGRALSPGSGPRSSPDQTTIGPHHTGLSMLAAPTVNTAGPQKALSSSSASSSSSRVPDRRKSLQKSSSGSSGSLRRVTAPEFSTSSHVGLGITTKQVQSKLGRRAGSEGDLLKKKADDAAAVAAAKLKRQRSHRDASKKRHGVLSSLFMRDETHHDGRRSSVWGEREVGHNGGCLGFIPHRCAHFMNGGSAKWHDKRYGRVGRKAQAMQASQFILVFILVWFDNFKFAEDGTDSLDLEKMTKASIFYIPCGVSFLFFSVVPILDNTGLFETFGVEENDLVHTKKRIQACMFILATMSFVIAELATGLTGFSDSCIWIIISWVYGFGQYGFRGAFVLTWSITTIYIVGLFIGVSISTSGKSIGLKVAALVGLLWIPLSVIFSVIEVQIERAAKMTAKEAEGREQLLEQVAMTEKLLQTVLPKAIIPQVKQISALKDVAIAHTYESCTICFAKITGIHHLFETQPTVSVLAQVDELYKAIDAETDIHAVEKIKTVGDVYMAASGLPQKNSFHAIIMVDFCFAIAKHVHFFAHKWEEAKLGFKIGVSSGPIVAGVIGQNKYTYDLWGDAANTASRMYSFGKKGKIQTTESTVTLVKSHYRCTERGVVNIKGKGDMMCYYVHGRLPSYTEANMSKSVQSEELEEMFISRQHGGSDEHDPAHGGINKRKGNLQKLGNEGMDLKIGDSVDVTNHLKVGKKEWVADSDSKFCTECGKAFTLTFRRHHCRFCGRLLCSDCTQHKLLKQRACDSCIDTYNDATQTDVFMHRHQVRRVQKKTSKAQRNFRNPYGSMYHCCRSGTSAALEYEYLVDRKNNVRELVVRCWFFMLIVCIVLNHLINEFYLPFKCHDHLTLKEFECSDRDHPRTGFSPAGQILLLSSHGKLDFDADGSFAGYVAPFLRVPGSATISDAEKGKLPGVAPVIHGFKDTDRRRAVTDFIAALATTYGANETQLNETNAWMVTHVGESNGGTFTEDNPITVIGYAKAGSNISMAYGYERMMIVKNTLMYVILPVMVVFLFFSRQEYNIVPRQEWMESQKSSVARDPGKPPPGKYTKQDHKFISLQVALAVVLLLALTVAMSVQAALGGSNLHGYQLVYTVWAVNLFSDVPNFYAFLVTIISTVCYFVFILIDIENNPVGGSAMLTFFIEKYLPVVFVASIAGHKLDTKHRSHFMGQLSARKTKRDADIEKRKNFNLVPLPPAIRDMMRQAADEGIEDNQIVLDAYGSVLFADIVSFTVFSTGLDPLHLVRVLNEMFSMHDNLAVRLGIDKIKTLGDCYVASTGLLVPTGNHASLLVKFGIGMHDVMYRLNTKFDLHGKGPKNKDLRIRVGVASGPVVGGVVGGKKFLFDIWGDTVEQSELMESEGVPERVHMSESTYLRAKKDQDLRFEKDDKTRHEGGNGIKDYEKEFSYLAIMPSNIPGWLDELFPVSSQDDQADGGGSDPTHRKSHVGSMHSLRKNRRSNSYGDEDVKDAAGKKTAAVSSSGDSMSPKADPGKKERNSEVSTKETRRSLSRANSARPGSKNFNRGSASKKSMAFNTRTKKRRSTASTSSGRNSIFASNASALSREIKFEGVPSAEMKRQARDLAAKKARERRTYRASFYSPAPPKQPTVKEGAKRLEEIAMVNNPMRKSRGKL